MSTLPVYRETESRAHEAANNCLANPPSWVIRSQASKKMLGKTAVKKTEHGHMLHTFPWNHCNSSRQASCLTPAVANSPISRTWPFLMQCIGKSWRQLLHQCHVHADMPNRGRAAARLEGPLPQRLRVLWETCGTTGAAAAGRRDKDAGSSIMVSPCPQSSWEEAQLWRKHKGTYQTSRRLEGKLSRNK